MPGAVPGHMLWSTLQAWNPSYLSGLEVWLDASAIEGVAAGGTVSTWDDVSTNGYAFTSSNSAPTLQLNVFNGYPVVRFDGVDDSVENAADATDVANFSIFAAFIPQATAGNFFISEKGTGTSVNWYLWYNGALQAGFNNGVGFDDHTTAVTLSSGVGVVWAYVLDDASNLLRMIPNSTEDSTDETNSAVTTGSQIVNIASGRDDANFTEVDVAEMLIYSRALSTDETILVLDYLSHKYGVST